MLNYNQAVALSITGSTPGMLSIPSGLKGFKQTLLTVERVAGNEGTKQKTRIHRTLEFRFAGFCDSSNEPKTCPSCGAPLLRNGSFSTDLRHIPMGGNYSVVKARRDRFRCSNPECKYCKTAEIDFKSKGHLITEPLRDYAEKQLAFGMTLKQVAHLTWLHKDVVKDIDKTRLEKMYAAEGEDGKRTLIKPETQVRYLGMDEFKLHDGYRFATLIMDMETGCILWLQEGKKKQVVYDFIEHAGLEWMSKVEAVSADMTSDFEEAFLDKCPHRKIVFDRFRIVKNLNDKVISEVRKDEQKRLIEEGDIEGAKSLKGCRYILMANWDTLKEKDAEAREGKLVSKGSELFKKEPVKMKQNQLSRYCRLIKENELFFCLDYVKESVADAYRQQNTEEMRIKIKNIVSYCRAVGNVHFDWFARFLDNHIDGIVTHAEFHLTN